MVVSMMMQGTEDNGVMVTAVAKLAGRMESERYGE
jgi:hypothetical protein